MVVIDQSPREPATVEEAVALLDMRSLPVFEGAEFRGDRVQIGQLTYEVKAGIQQVYEFQRQQLIDRGWQELSEGRQEGEYPSAFFTQRGFVLHLSASKSYEPDKNDYCSLSLCNCGNVLLSKLPVPRSVQPHYPSPRQASYVTTDDAEATREWCRNSLLDLGWNSYGSAGDTMYFKQNAIKLSARVSTHDNQPGKTFISYDAELLSADIPMPEGVEHSQYIDSMKRLTFVCSNTRFPELTNFYTSSFANHGWQPTSEPVTDDRTTSVVYRNAGGDIITLDMENYNERSRVAVVHRSAGEIATLAQEMRDEAQKQAAKMAGVDANSSANVKLPIPGKALKVEQAEPNSVAITVAKGTGKSISEAWQKHFVADGWQANIAQLEQQFGVLQLSKDGLSLNLNFVDTGLANEVTLQVSEISGSGAVLQPDREVAAFAALGSSTGPMKSGKPSLEDLAKSGDVGGLENAIGDLVGGLLGGLGGSDKPAVGGLPMKDDASEVEPKSDKMALRVTEVNAGKGEGNVKLNDQSFPMHHAIAYQTTEFDETSTIVFVSEKPFRTQSLKGKSVDEMSIFDARANDDPPTMELRLRGDYVSLSCFVDGKSINFGSPKIKSEAKVVDGHLRGKVSLAEPEEFFDDLFQFTIVLDVPLMKCAEQAASARELVDTGTYSYPLPEGCSEAEEKRTPYRSVIRGTLKAELAQVVDFYRSALADSGWHEDSKAAKIEKAAAQMSFEQDGNVLSVQLRFAADETQIALASRDSQRAQKDGVAPKPGKSRLMLGNASDSEIVITVDDKDHKLAAGVGGENPAEAIKLDIEPGKHTITTKVPGEKPETEQIDAKADTTWGVIGFPGGAFVQRIY
jgi:hypothetical protein